MILPACCYATEGASLAEQLYAAYNAGGDPATAGLNYKGDPCPTWDQLPDNVRQKWQAAAGEYASQAEGRVSFAVSEIHRILEDLIDHARLSRDGRGLLLATTSGLQKWLSLPDLRRLAGALSIIANDIDS